MNTKEWLEKVAHIGKSEIPDDDGDVYYSDFDDSYITRVGMEDGIKYLAEREITDNLTHGVGFSPKDQKWYGWSHRAIYGFEAGSTCKKGDCHYRAANLEDELEAAVQFWWSEDHIDTKAELREDGTIHVSWTLSSSIPNKKMRGMIDGSDWHYDPDKFGKGEWVAKNLHDAYQMACDFNEGVS